MKAGYLKKVQEINNIYTFYFNPPKPQKYYPGQYYYVSLKGITKQFTLSSSPTEKFISITTKANPHSEFKQALFSLHKDSQIEIEGPNGVFFADTNIKGSQIFIAGGMGITPFRSMVKYFRDKKFKPDIKLIYSSSEGFLFKEFFINADLLDKKIDKKLLQTRIVKNATYWICGPTGMVSAVEDILIKLKVAPDKILSEKFLGY